MTRILVVEDSPEQGLMIVALLRGAGFEATLAENGALALESIDDSVPDLVVTDLIMPRMNGLQLVEEIKERYSHVPVVLMTAFGSDEIAARALEKGAASYVPKRRLREELVPTARDLLAVARVEREQARVLEKQIESDTRFVLESDQTLIPPLVRRVQDQIRSRWSESDEGDLMQIGVAMQEALLNAMHHGNLEVDSELRETGGDLYQQTIEQRRRTAPYGERRVAVRARLNAESLIVDVQDEGPGFDPRRVGNPTDPSNLERVSGRGLYLIFTFMDEVRHNETGNSITIVKRRLGKTSKDPA